MVVPITIHFPSRADALHAQTWLDGRVVVATLEETYHWPGRPWSLVLVIDTDLADGVSAATPSVQNLYRQRCCFAGKLTSRGWMTSDRHTHGWLRSYWRR